MIQSQSPFLHPVDSSGADDALAAPSPTTTKPVPGASGVLEAAYQEAVRLFFGGTDAADETVNYQVIGWTPLFTGTTWIPRVLAKGAFTLGTATYGASGLELGAAAGFLADTVTDTIADAVWYSPADNTVAFLEIDCRNCQFIQIQTDLGTAATADVFAQFGEAVATAQIVGSVNVTGGLTDTQLRAATVPVTEASGAGIATSAAAILANDAIADTRVDAPEAITGADQALAGGTAYKHWRLWGNPDSAVFAVNFTTAGTAAALATNNNYQPGDVVEVSFTTAQKAHAIGASAAGKINVRAW